MITNMTNIAIASSGIIICLHSLSPLKSFLISHFLRYWLYFVTYSRNITFDKYFFSIEGNTNRVRQLKLHQNSSPPNTQELLKNSESIRFSYPERIVQEVLTITQLNCTPYIILFNLKRNSLSSKLQKAIHRRFNIWK